MPFRSVTTGTLLALYVFNIRTEEFEGTGVVFGGLVVRGGFVVGGAVVDVVVVVVVVVSHW